MNDAVNYLGHAVIANERSSEPAFVLGAMLPDLANMLRVRLPRLDHEGLARGVVFHERTDAVFHQLPSFIELNREALVALRARQVSRGPARAAAHLGTEMLIDAALTERPGALDGYLRALDEGARAPLAFWSPVPSALSSSLGALLAQLNRGGAAIHAPSRERFVTRFSHALGPRARLAPTPDELTAIAEFCASYFEVVAQRLPSLLDELNAGLGGSDAGGSFRLP